MTRRWTKRSSSRCVKRCSGGSHRTAWRRPQNNLLRLAACAAAVLAMLTYCRVRSACCADSPHPCGSPCGPPAVFKSAIHADLVGVTQSAFARDDSSEAAGYWKFGMHELEGLIDAAWERRAVLGAADANALRTPLDQVMDALEAGSLRVAGPDGQGGWRVNQWVKRAILLYFRAHDVRMVDGGPMAAFDKVPLRFAGADEAAFRNAGARVVPGALVRRGAFVGKDAVLMPSY